MRKIFLLMFFLLIFSNFVFAFDFNNDVIFLNHPSFDENKNREVIFLNEFDDNGEGIIFLNSESEGVGKDNVGVEKRTIDGSCKEGSVETNEGPGGDDCDYYDYEQCYNYFIKSTAIAYDWAILDGGFHEEERGTDYCSSDYILQEAYINCGLLVVSPDKVKYKEKDCTDFDYRSDNWVYYCTDDEVRKRHAVSDYHCSEGACKIKISEYRHIVESEEGDADYCHKRWYGFRNDWEGCTLCGHEDSDCDFDSECAGNLKCKGEIGKSVDGCCYDGEEWDADKMECVKVHVECYDDSDCPDNLWTGSSYCSIDKLKVLGGWRIYDCKNPGKANSKCTSFVNEQVKEYCVYGCENKKCVEIECSRNSDCGTDGYVGFKFCKSNDEYKKYKTYKCNNPRTKESFCSDVDKDEKIEECGTSGYTGNNFCYDGDVYKNYRNKGCSNNQCSSNIERKKQEDCGAVGCSNDKCKAETIECSRNSDCGTNAYVGSKFCKSNDEYKKYKTYKCNSAGTVNSYCSDSTADKRIKDCGAVGCSNDKCNSITCTSHASSKCYNHDLYWYDSCNKRETKKQECGTLGCLNNKCNEKEEEIKCSKNSDCGVDEWTGDSPFCKNNNVWGRWKTWTCHDAGQTNSWCQNNDADKFKLDCKGGCSRGKCKEETKKPDLTITDLVVQYSNNKKVVLGFSVKNIGEVVAENVLWLVDTDSGDENVRRTKGVNLEPGSFTRAYMMLIYSKSGKYTPEVIVDPNSNIKESNENNNEKSISVSV